MFIPAAESVDWVRGEVPPVDASKCSMSLQSFAIDFHYLPHRPYLLIDIWPFDNLVVTSVCPKLRKAISAFYIFH